MGGPDLRRGGYAAELEEPAVYRARRERLLEATGEGIVVVWGAGDDRGYGDVGTFRQDPDFFYLTGVELPGAVLALRREAPRQVLFLPRRNPALERWTGPKWGPGEEAAGALGFDAVYAVEPTETVVDARRRPVPGFAGRLAGWLRDAGVVWTPLPRLGPGDPLTPGLETLARLRDRLPTFAVRDARPHLDRLRLVKSPGEIALIRRAVAATVAGQRAAAAAIAPGVTERAVAGAVYAAMTAAGAEGLAFPSIVGAGFAATVLHYDQNSGTCGDGELVVVDVGARYGGYCGDLTRTYPVSGRFDPRQAAYYRVVLAAHDAAAAAIRPGTTLGELRRIAYETIDRADVRDAAGNRLGRHFIHGIGHFLGLEPHDAGGEEPELEPGMVITVEPGVYIPEEAVGIRIENDFLVTDGGAENLSAALPTAPEAVEAMVGPA